MTRAAVLCVLVAACAAPAQAPAQPIAFDHRVHVHVTLESGALQCTDCHPGAERRAHAGLPAITTCLRCHMRPQGDPPSEKERAVRVAAAAGGDFRWIQVTREPGHVYFAHAPHVTIAKIDCATCHGDVARWDAPPTTPREGLLDMSRCLACHRERGAPTDCETCHQ
jgi:c(7)-type cytochrome triheme protein